MKIVIIAGTQNKNSITFRLSKHLKRRIKSDFLPHEVTILDSRQYNLPLDTQVFKSIQEIEHDQKLLELYQIMTQADAFIISTPEYNGSYSPAIKNILNHFPKFHRKAFGIVTSSDGALGGTRAAIALQSLVPAHFGILCPAMLIVPQVTSKFDENGELILESFQKSVDNFLNDFIWLAEKLAK